MANILIQIKEKCIWFSPHDSISLEYTNLPTELFTFSSRPMYWKLNMLSFDKRSRALTVNISDYDATDTEAWHKQVPKSRIDKLVIQEIVWEPFTKCLSYYDGTLKKSITSLLSQLQTKENLNIKPVTLLHRVSINKMKIGSGQLSYTKKVRWSKNPITFTIEHPLMIPEMELIKPYFHNIMKGKMVDIEVTVVHKSDHVEVLKTHAPQLQKINKESLYIMRGLQIKDWVKSQKEEYQTNILQEDIDLDYDPSETGNIDPIERELLNRILEESDAKNKHQLLYLSDATSPTDKLMLTIQPQFGFIFTIRGDEMIHCIWELVNSHATYIWSFPQAFHSDRYFNILRREFAKITEIGRQAYRDTYAENPDFYLRTVNHGSSTDPMVDRFGRWRVRLESYLV